MPLPIKSYDWNLVESGVFEVGDVIMSDGCNADIVFQLNSSGGSWEFIDGSRGTGYLASGMAGASVSVGISKADTRGVPVRVWRRVIPLTKDERWHVESCERDMSMLKGGQEIWQPPPPPKKKTLLRLHPSCQPHPFFLRDEPPKEKEVAF